MAMSATISVSPSSVFINMPAVATLTVSNSSGSPVQVTGIVPDARLTGGAYSNPPGVAFGQVPLGPGSNITVPASGSLIFNFNVIFFAPSGPLNQSTQQATSTYDVSATVTSNDGSIFSPTADTLQVNPIQLPASEFP